MDTLMLIAMFVFVIHPFILVIIANNVSNQFYVMVKVQLTKLPPSVPIVFVLNPMFGEEIDVINVFMNVILQMVLLFLHVTHVTVMELGEKLIALFVMILSIQITVTIEEQLQMLPVIIVLVLKDGPALLVTSVHSRVTVTVPKMPSARNVFALQELNLL